MTPSQITLTPVTAPSQICQVAELAHIIWNQHYPAIIGQAQVDYMVPRFQSPQAIAQQIAQGMQYFLLCCQQQPVGYLGFEERSEDNSLFLSKIYLLDSARGKGLARAAVEWLMQRARDQERAKIWLTVNVNNHLAITAYQKLGFEKKGTCVQDIGGGYVMDDFRMVLEL